MDSSISKEQLKKFADIYLKFIDELNHVYNKDDNNSELGKRFREQKKWVLLKLRRNDSSLVTKINENLELYQDEIKNLNENLFNIDDEKCLRMGRIDFRSLGQHLKYNDLLISNKRALWKYLQTLLFLSKSILDKNESKTELLELVQGLKQVQILEEERNVEQPPMDLSAIMDPKMQMFMKNAIQSEEMQNMLTRLTQNGIFQDIESKLKEQFSGNGEQMNPMELLQKVMSKDVNLEGIMKDIAKNVEENIDEKERASLANSIMGDGNEEFNPDTIKNMLNMMSRK